MKVKTMKLSIIMALFLVTGGYVQLNAQEKNADQTTPESRITDEAFISKNIRDNQQEIELAQLAINKSENENVKEVAGILVDHHGKMVKDLKKIAKEEGIQVDEEGMNDADDNVATEQKDYQDEIKDEKNMTKDQEATNEEVNENEAEVETRSEPGDTGTASNQLDIAGQKTSKDIDNQGEEKEEIQEGLGARSDQEYGIKDELEKAEGGEFDSLWVSQTLVKHKIKLGELHQAKKSVDDPELKELIDDAIPAVRDHRDMLTDIKNNPDEPLNVRGKHKDGKASTIKKGKQTTSVTE